MTHRPPPLPTVERAHQTEKLIAQKATDLARWSQVESLATQWDARAAMAAEFIPANVRVLDIGCGAMALESALKSGCRYFPCDVVERRPGCFVADLNRQQFPTGRYDWITFLGVLEYIHDFEWPLSRARDAAANLLVTYCCFVGDDAISRRGLGWVNDLRQEEFEALLRRSGWRVTERREVKRGYSNIQMMFVCGSAT